MPPSTKSLMPSLSESTSWKSGVPSPSVSVTGSFVIAVASATVLGVSAVFGFASTTSARPSLSASAALSTKPSLLLSVPPASTISTMPSLSESRSKLSIMPSPSVSRFGLPLSSTRSGIPSLSSSRSIRSGMPSPSESPLSPKPSPLSTTSGMPSPSVSIALSIMPSPSISSVGESRGLFGSNGSGVPLPSASGIVLGSTNVFNVSIIPSPLSSLPPASTTSLSPSLSLSRSR